MDNGLLNQIKSRAFWQTVIRPERFAANHIDDYSRLFPIVRDSAVSLRGWNFPHVEERRENRKDGPDWVGEESEWQDHLELWRLYQSGQFVSILGLWSDWRERTVESHSGVGPANILPLWDTIYRCTEIYEFAARLALTEAGDATMHVGIKIGNLQGRMLVQDSLRKTSLRHYVFAAEGFSHAADSIAREALIAQPREYAATALLELFRRFDFAVTLEGIRSWQEELDKW